MVKYNGVCSLFRGLLWIFITDDYVGVITIVIILNKYNVGSG